MMFVAIPALAGPVPSKTAVNQSLESREADLSVIRDVAANEQVAAVLTAHGFSSENLEQLQPAGLTRQEWIWIGIGALAALILVVALA
jgi:hypothetical protein